MLDNGRYREYALLYTCVVTSFPLKYLTAAKGIGTFLKCCDPLEPLAGRLGERGRGGGCGIATAGGGRNDDDAWTVR